MLKVVEARDALAHLDWLTVTPVAESTWRVERLRELIEGASLCVDATGNSLFAELLSRIADDAGVDLVSTALFRGGRVARVRRQADGDMRIVNRTGHWRYPLIPPGDTPQDDFLGREGPDARPRSTTHPRPR